MKLTLTLIIIVFLYSCTNKAIKISEWRGPNRSGVYNETGLLNQWPDDGPELLWKIDSTGRGYGSPVIYENRIFVNGEIDSIAYLFCYDNEGKLIWKSDIGYEWVKNFEGARSTPTVAGDLIYVSTGKGDIACVEKDTGRKKWSLNMINDLNGRNNVFGYSQSLLVNGDLVYCSPGGIDNNIVALNRFDGKLIWAQKAKGEVEAYNSPLIVKRKKLDLLLTFSEDHFMGIDGQTGNLLWNYPQDTVGTIHGNIPMVDGNEIIYVAGNGNRTEKLVLSDNDTKVSQVWKNTEFDNIMGGVVKLDNMIYGTGHRKMYLMALDSKTGLITDSVKMFRGSTIAADNKLFVYTEKGDMNLIDISNKTLKPTSSFKIKHGTKEHFAHPVIHNGVLYVRHGQTLLAYSIKDKA